LGEPISEDEGRQPRGPPTRGDYSTGEKTSPKKEKGGGERKGECPRTARKQNSLGFWGMLLEDQQKNHVFFWERGWDKKGKKKKLGPKIVTSRERNCKKRVFPGMRTKGEIQSKLGRARKVYCCWQHHFSRGKKSLPGEKLWEEFPRKRGARVPK